MAEPNQKDALDIAIDFFFGAVFVDFWIALGFLRASSRQINFHWQWPTFGLCLLAATCIAGSMAALYRNRFWSGYETYSILPTMEQSVSKRSKIVLWIIFGVGCVSLVSVFVW